MKILDNEELQRMVDYSFGDHSGVLGGVPNAYMRKANIHNADFMDSVESHEGTMTLFIDNIRLYKRPLEYSDWLHMKHISPQDRVWLAQFQDEDLLELCSLFPYKKFVIFTAFEDTPLDDFIWDRIPDNVASINAANAVVFGGKVRPFPHGIERKMHIGYERHEILRDYIEDNTEATKTLFICHRDDTGARGSIRDIFRDREWATVSPKLDYEPYLQGIKDHRFVLCPSGNGIESARNWETLYMRRVPVFKRHPYLEEMFKDVPAIFVDEWKEVTEQLLKDSEHLYQKALTLDYSKMLDLDYQFKSRI